MACAVLSQDPWQFPAPCLAWPAVAGLFHSTEHESRRAPQELPLMLLRQQWWCSRCVGSWDESYAKQFVEGVLIQASTLWRKRILSSADSWFCVSCQHRLKKTCEGFFCICAKCRLALGSPPFPFNIWVAGISELNFYNLLITFHPNSWAAVKVPQ